MIELYIWIGVIIVALIVEFLTTQMVSVWFAVGGVIALIIKLIGLDWYFQVPTFFVVSALMIWLLRRMALKYLNPRAYHTNADSAIDKEYILLTPISFGQEGSIRVKGVVWTAVTEDPDEEVEAGTKVRVKYIRGNKYIIEVV